MKTRRENLPSSRQLRRSGWNERFHNHRPIISLDIARRMQLYWKILMTHDIWINKMAQNEIFYNLRSRFSMYEIQMSTIHVDIHFLFSLAWPRGRATSMVQLIRELKHKLKVLPVLMSFSIFRLGFQRSNVSPKTAKSGNFEDQRWQVSWIFNSGIRSQRRLRLCTGLPRHQPLARFKG